MLFAPEMEDAIDRFAKQEGLSRDDALAQIVRDWQVGQGILEAGDDDNTDADGLSGAEDWGAPDR